jgi:hypothetical protein
MAVIAVLMAVMVVLMVVMDVLMTVMDALTTVTGVLMTVTGVLMAVIRCHHGNTRNIAAYFCTNGLVVSHCSIKSAPCPRFVSF